MTETLNILIGILVLILGLPIGNFLAKYTKEELKQGRKWFKLLILIGLIGGIVGLIIRNDVILFSFLFIAIVTSRALSRDLITKANLKNNERLGSREISRDIIAKANFKKIRSRGFKLFRKNYFTLNNLSSLTLNTSNLTPASSQP